MKNPVLKIMFWSAVALIIPLLGNQFVDGWNWHWNEFLFAWVFFVVMSLSIRWVMRRVSSTVFSKYKIVAGVAVFLAFAFVWVMLATG